MLVLPFCYPKVHCCSGALKFAVMLGNIFSTKCLMDSLIAMPESSCILYRFSGGM